MKIKMNKKYRTVNGLDVKILDTNIKNDFSVVGKPTVWSDGRTSFTGENVSIWDKVELV